MKHARSSLGNVECSSSTGDLLRVLSFCSILALLLGYRAHAEPLDAASPQYETINNVGDGLNASSPGWQRDAVQRNVKRFFLCTMRRNNLAETEPSDWL